MAGKSATRSAASDGETRSETVPSAATTNGSGVSNGGAVPGLDAALGPSNGDASLARTEIFEVLSNERRRLVLRYLQQRDVESGVDFRDLVDQVAAWENDTTIDRLDSSDRKCVYTALRQTHLPKMDEFGVVEYDSRRGTVTPSETTEDVMVYMEYVPEYDVSWSRVYLLLAALSGTIAAFAWVGAYPFGGVSGSTIAALTAVLFGAAAIAQAYQSRTIRPSPR